ncbi:EpsG family protein [Sphingomonas sinipercae]|uniref:EpsG family protein n=1 Tax=Sphingomonas sinipercae TaxID=2714944 RepID=A0A6G7ZNC3_9SPHN|nr:EpsG family protein [Sphingomonas sinipercae]QIL02419.1 EpsG family protein [Sphingomonas sinipercae]
MFPYWILFGCFSFATLIGSGGERDRRNAIFLTVASVFVVIFMGLRFQVGGDWINYRIIYNDILYRGMQWSLESGRADPAYILLNWISQQLKTDIWLVNIVCAASLMWGIVEIAKRQPNPFLIVLIAIPYLIIVVGMGYTRQASAIGLSMVALVAFLDKRWAKCVAAMILAALFHKSAVILVPIVGLSYSRSRIVTISMFALLSVILFELVVSSRLETMSENYMTAQLQSQGANIRVAMNTLAAVLFLIAQRRFGFEPQERVLWRNISFASLLAVPAILLTSSSTVVDRLSLYFIMLQLVVLGRLPWAYTRNRSVAALLIGIVMAYSATIQFVWLNYANNAYWWLPYRSILSDVPERKVGRPGQDE